MKRLSAILFFICPAIFCHAQNDIFQTLITKSNSIVKATVLEFGRRMRFEEGVIHYSVKCRVDVAYKGAFKQNDTICIEITEFTNDLGGRFIDENKDSLIKIGKPVLFFLSEKEFSLEQMVSDTKLEPVYSLIDICLGAQPPTPEMTYYLENIRK
jgi:hypothetical protein